MNNWIKSTTQSYRTPVYYVDLTLREGVNLQQAIQMAKDIDQQSKQSGFNQSALDHTARQGFANAQFEVNSEEGLDLVEEFYMDKSKLEQHQQTHDLSHAQDIQKGLQQSVQALNWDTNPVLKHREQLPYDLFFFVKWKISCYFSFREYMNEHGVNQKNYIDLMDFYAK